MWDSRANALVLARPQRKEQGMIPALPNQPGVYLAMAAFLLAAGVENVIGVEEHSAGQVPAEQRRVLAS